MKNVQAWSDSMKKAHDYILQHFNLVKGSSFVQDFTLWDMMRMRGVLLSEIHVSDQDRVVNSKLVDLLSQSHRNFEVFLETEGGVQIPHAGEEVRASARCWDISQNEKSTWLSRSYLLKDAYCSMCLAYVRSFLDGQMDFMKFLEEYMSIKRHLRKFLKEDDKPELSEFLEDTKVAGICTKASIESNLDVKRQYLIELIAALRNETRASLQFSSQLIDSKTEMRDELLTLHLKKSIADNQFPIFVAGHYHVISKQIQGLKDLWRLLALQRKSPERLIAVSGAERDQETLKVWNRLAAEIESSPFPHLKLVPQILTGVYCGSKEQRKAYISRNRELIATLKPIMQTYEFNQSWMPIWASIPVSIYLSDLQYYSEAISNSKSI